MAFKKGDRVRCVDATPSEGTQLEKERVYTISKVFRGNQMNGDAPIPGMEKTPGCCVEGLNGYFVQSRFTKHGD